MYATVLGIYVRLLNQLAETGKKSIFQTSAQFSSLQIHKLHSTIVNSFLVGSFVGL